MTTELDIHTLARRLREAYPMAYTAISLDVDNHSSGRTTFAWGAYRAKEPDGFIATGLGVVSPDFPTLAELAEWLEANWLKEVQS